MSEFLAPSDSSTAWRTQGAHVSYREARSAEPRRYAFIDALRGWAILLVILTHAGQGRAAIEYLTSSTISGDAGLQLPHWLEVICRNAEGGVQLFFVVSAFSLTLSWSTRGSMGGGLGKYFLRRFFRIAPMFYIAIALYLIVFGTHPRGFAPHGIGPKDILLTIAFLNTWSRNALNSVVPGDWSVGAEVMFYVLLPLMLVSLRSFWPTLAATFVAVVATQLRFEFLVSHHMWDAYSYFEFPNQIVVFMLGVLAAMTIRLPVVEQALLRVETDGFRSF